LAHHSLGFVRLQENLARLSEAHQQANVKQLPPAIFSSLKKSSLFENGNPQNWLEHSSAEFLKYCDFSNLENRQWNFIAPTEQPNRVLLQEANSYKVIINDFSQGASWEVPEGSEVQPLHNVLTEPDLFSIWKKFFNEKWPSHTFSNWNRGFLYSGLCFLGKEEVP